jgi:hypothetical protein
MKTNRERAIMLLDKLTNEGDGITERQLLEYLINDYMDGAEAYQALLAAEQEFFGGDEDEYDEEYSNSKYKMRNED